MITIEKLDKMVQEIASTKVSQISNQHNPVGHHVIRRSNLLFRWDLNNILFCSKLEHKLIHSIAGYEDSILTLNQKIYKERNNNRSFKQYLVMTGLTEQEFLDIKYLELKQLMPNKYELYLKNKELNGIATYSEKLKEKKEIAVFNSKVKLREIKPKNRLLVIAKDYRKQCYERNKKYKEQLKYEN